MASNSVLAFSTVGQASWQGDADAAGPQVGMASVRHVRFGRRVRVDEFRLWPRMLRWAPEGPGQPAHVTLSVAGDGGEWRVVADAALPPFESSEPHVLTLPGILTDHLRVVCDLEHPVPPAHGQLCASPEVVPFAILDSMEFRGVALDERPYEAIHNPPLRRGAVAPEAPVGMCTKLEPHQVLFSGPSFSVGFSLRRPIMVHLGFDAAGEGLSATNLSASARCSQGDRLFESGPVLRLLSGDAFATAWTGEVEVAGSLVSYRGLTPGFGVELDVTFDVRADGMSMAWRLKRGPALAPVEFDIWRVVWEGRTCVTGTWGVPDMDAGRTGRLQLPVRWSAPGHGTALVRELGGSASGRTQAMVDSWRAMGVGWCGFGPVGHGTTGWPTEQSGGVDITVEAVLPELKPGVAVEQLPVGLVRNWPSAFGYRSESGGVSNNAMSCNCHVSQGPPADMVAYTQRATERPHPLDLVRHTIELAFRGGPGYGDNRELYMDSNPNLVAAAGRLHQVAPDARWLSRLWPAIRKATDVITSSIDPSGLMLCRDLTGNRGSGRWSSNCWDVVSFGHYDAYSNAWGYRALKCAAVMARDAGDPESATVYSEAAARLAAAYMGCFYNPETGWLGGWRSADGELHDYCFTFVNGIAICYGLVPGPQAPSVVAAIEQKRKARGQDYFHYGLATNLDPLPPYDQPASHAGTRLDGWDKFGIYINGCLTPVFAQFYLRALSMYGSPEAADEMCRHLEEAFLANRFSGGLDTGREFFTWEGRPCGYEGTLVGNFPVLLSIAQHRGWVEPLSPEWWPA